MNIYIVNSDENIAEKETIAEFNSCLENAFPNADEIYKQSLTDELILFSKSINRDRYQLTFGSDPTFQELFFEIRRKNIPLNTKIK